ncbi:50S ribosomal protein L17 [bacterium]|nr:MAG: 50S ribosomal protein L17 [bacterium]
MRHNRDEKRFDRTYSHLRSMFANMTNDLIFHGRITTTTPRAKALRSYAEKMITLGKNGSLASRRRAFAFLRSKEAVTKLFAEIAPLFTGRNGGYTRLMKLGNRPGDNASMSVMELVESKSAVVAGADTKKAKTAAPKAKKAPVAKVKAASKKASSKPTVKKAAKEKTALKTRARKAEKG